MIIGHQKQQQFLRKIVSSGKIPHALLFSGPEELGKKTIALELLSSLFKEDLFSHPDFTLITPATRQIRITQIRGLNWRLSLKPIKAPLLGVVIDQAHLMTREAQNCFLKTLEEPKTETLLILITEYPNYLLPTIISRCENVKFYPVKNEEIRFFLKKEKLPKDKIEEIVELSLGRPGKVVNFLQNLEKLKERRKRIKKLIEISDSPLSLRFENAKELSKQEDFRETLKDWLFYFRKALISKKSTKDLLKIKEIINAIQETIFVTSNTNANPRLALEVLMMKF